MRVVRPHWGVGMRARGSSFKRDSCSDCPDFFCSIRFCMNMEVFAKPGQFYCLGEEIDRGDSGGCSRGNVGEPGPLQAQEWTLQPLERGSGQRECDRKRTEPRKRPGVRMVVSGKKTLGELQPEKVIRVKTVRNLAQIYEPGILQEGKPVLGSSQHREEDCNASERHQRISNHASKQCWYRIQQAATQADNEPRGNSHQKQRQPFGKPDAERWTSVENHCQEYPAGDGVKPGKAVIPNRFSSCVFEQQNQTGQSGHDQQSNRDSA